jgi:hypothetical protein
MGFVIWLVLEVGKYMWWETNRKNVEWKTEKELEGRK